MSDKNVVPCVNCRSTTSRHRTVPDTCGCGEPLRHSLPPLEPPQPPPVIRGPQLTAEQRAENESRLRRWQADYAAWQERGVRVDLPLDVVAALESSPVIDHHDGGQERGGASGLGPAAAAAAVDLTESVDPVRERPLRTDACAAPTGMRGGSGLEARLDLLSVIGSEEQRAARDAAAAARGARCGAGRDARDMTRSAFREGWEAAVEWLRARA